MNPASVGFQCPECVREGARSTRQGRTAYGGARPATAGRVTLSLIAANAIVFVLVAVTGAGQSPILHRLWLLPQTVCLEGNFNVCLETSTGVADGAVWQPLTSMFTHVELWHIGFNMLALYILGPQLELMLGRTRFLALYLLSGLAGSAFVYWLAPTNSSTVGASGAIFGLMAALLIVAIRARGDVQGLLVLVAVNVVITVWGRGFISWEGHLGGFLGGLVIALVLVYAPRGRRTFWQVTGLSVFAVALLVAFVARTAMLA
jgi:membrane associated rhomboid family serine protease